jgi:ATP-dependent DNA ligase
MLYLLGQFLEGATREQDLGGSASEPPWRAVARDGLEVRRQVVERAYEGYVAKDEASGYENGPTRRWLGVKQKLDGRGASLAEAYQRGAAGSLIAVAFLRHRRLA